MSELKIQTSNDFIQPTFGTELYMYHPMATERNKQYGFILAQKEPLNNYDTFICRSSMDGEYIQSLKLWLVKANAFYAMFDTEGQMILAKKTLDEGESKKEYSRVVQSLCLIENTAKDIEPIICFWKRNRVNGINDFMKDLASINSSPEKYKSHFDDGCLPYLDKLPCSLWFHASISVKEVSFKDSRPYPVTKKEKVVKTSKAQFEKIISLSQELIDTAIAVTDARYLDYMSKGENFETEMIANSVPKI